MQTLFDEIEPAEGADSEAAPERKLTKEELLDLVGAYATKGEHLTRAERAVYAGQLADLMYPGKAVVKYGMIRLLSITSAERRAMAEEMAQTRKPARVPPPGKTWQDMVIGKWPGDETDEEINAWLKEIS